MSEKKEGRPKARSYELIEKREPGQRRTDPLEEAIDDEDRELAKEVKRTRLEEVIKERKVRLKELDKRLKGKSGEEETEGPMTTKALVTTLIQGGSDPKVVSEWLKGLDPQALGSLIALQSNNPALAAMAFGMGQRGQQLTTKDVIELNKAMREGGAGQPQITIDLAELIKAVRDTPGGAVSPKEIVDSTINAIKTGITLATPTGKKPESWFDKLMSTPEGVETAQKIGLFGGSPEFLRIQKEIRAADRQFLKESKEGDRRWQLRLQEYRDESRRRWAEVQEKRRRTQIAEGALKRVGRAVARAVSEAEEEEEFGEEEGKPAKKKRASKVKQYECEECGAVISVPLGIKPGATVTCASCGAVYEAEAEAKD